MRTSRTVVLNCAGIGSRLGIGRTKVLMEIGGKSLLERHLANFRNVEDLRIVVGFQSADVIAATLSIRSDVLFVYNHDYFDTSAGYSFWLGARFGTDELIQWDGDLVIHPDDAALCLSTPGTFAAYSVKRASDGVFCNVENDRVVSFSRQQGEYEWTGPCSIPFGDVEQDDEYVYEMLEKILPIKGVFVRAMDIDTGHDYRVAENLLAEWEK